MSKKYLIATDLRRCVGCGSCQVSCKMENNVPMFSYRARLNSFDEGDYPSVKRHFLHTACNQCEAPTCIEICPADATYKADGGIIVIDRQKCIGCGSCMEACPYGARYLRAFDKKHIADKCDYCKPLIDRGMEPACVRNCMGKAKVFGDINDKSSRIYKLLDENKYSVWQPGYGTKPQSVYILKYANTLTGFAKKINEVEE